MPLSPRLHIVAEIGSNWLGRPELALRHIDEAAECGATGVKFQLFRARTLYRNPPPGLEQYELPLDLLPKLRDRAHKHGLLFSVTPFAVDLAKELRGLVDEVKISAYDLTYQALIEEAAQLGVPLILSTAMSTEAEIRRALRWANTPATLLHGTACYPALLENSRLRRFLALQRQFPYQRWGLSDHTIDWRAAAGAVLLGAVHIEKHFALDGVPGITKSPDYPHSIPPRYFSILVQHCLSSLSMLGDGEKAGPLPCEEPLYKLRRTNERPLR